MVLTKLPRVSLVAQMVNNLPEMQETRFQSLGWEDPLKKRMAIHSSILAWRIPQTEEPCGLYIVHGAAKSHTQLNKKHTILPLPQDAHSAKLVVDSQTLLNVNQTLQ